MKLRRARQTDLTRVASLLSEAGLPALDPHPNLSNLFVAEREGVVIGAAGLNVHARTGLLGVLVVTPDERAHGVGHSLFHVLLSRTNELGLRELYVVARSAEDFLRKLGFRPLPREDAPPEIRTSRALNEEGSESAPLLRLTLED